MNLDDAAVFASGLDDAELRSMVEALRAANPQGAVLALVADASRDVVPRLQAMCRELGMPLFGGVFPALHRDLRFVSSGAWLIGLATAPQHVLLERVSDAADPVAARVAAVLTVPDGATPTLFMLFDGTTPNVGSIVDDLYLALADAVHYVGVSAGSETFEVVPCVFDGERCVADAVLCVLLPPGTATACAHGYTAPADAVTATATTGNRVLSIDWKPAFEVYRAKVRQRLGVELRRENLYDYVAHFPLGIVLANGQVIVRIPVGLDDAGAVRCIGEVPENALLTMLEAPPPDSPETCETLAAALPSGRGQLLTFYCAGRRMHLGAAAERELAALSTGTGATLCGALSLGEVGADRVGTYPRFHNGMVVCVDVVRG